MNSPSDHDLELMRYFDHALSEEETHALEDRLRQSKDLRVTFRELSLQAVAMGDLGRVMGGFETAEKHPSQTAYRERKGRATQVLLTLAAMLALMAGSLLWYQSRVETPPIATVDYVEGSVQWNDATGKLTRQLAPSTPIGAGTLTVESASGSAQIRFTDGTALTFLGESEAHLSQHEGRKQILLDRGQLTASVTPQPGHQPLTVITPTAEIEVLGTVLAITVEDTETALAVNTGRVAVRRLADGERIEVPAGQSVVATLNTRAPMVPTSELLWPTEWKLERSQPNEVRITKGRETQWMGTDCLDSEFYVAGRDELGHKVVRRGVSINGPIHRGDSLVQLEPGSILRLRYRSEAVVSIFLSTKRPGGGFGGNFEIWIPPAPIASDPEGWRTVQVPIHDFQRLKPQRTNWQTPPLHANRLSKILVSVGAKHSLQLADVEVQTQKLAQP